MSGKSTLKEKFMRFFSSVKTKIGQVRDKVIKPETEEHKVKRHAKEAKQLARLEKELARPQGKGYIWYFIFIITVVYIVDEVVSQIGTQMQSIIINEIFVPVVGADRAVATLETCAFIYSMAGTLAALYRPLADKYGRKPFLVINTLGMGLSMFIIGVCTNIPVYVMGMFILQFFVPHDMQAIYIMETVKKEKRATMYSYIKAVATLGVFLIPLLREIFMPNGDTANWRWIFIVICGVAAVISCMAFLMIKESPVFLRSRIAYLKMTDEERNAAKENKETRDQATQGSFINGIKVLFKHKQLLWISVAYGFLQWGMLMTNSYEKIMTDNYAISGVADPTDVVTKALLLFAVGSAFFQFITGFISDKLGRKKAAVIMAVFSALAYILFFVGSRFNWSPYIVGIACGSMVGAYWASLDSGIFIVNESTPTSVRMSVGTIQTLLSGIILGGGTISKTVGLWIFTDEALGTLVSVLAYFGVAIGLIIMMINVQDTKGIDLNNVHTNRLDEHKEGDIDVPGDQLSDIAPEINDEFKKIEEEGLEVTAVSFEDNK